MFDPAAAELTAMEAEGRACGPDEEAEVCGTHKGDDDEDAEEPPKKKSKGSVDLTVLAAKGDGAKGARNRGSASSPSAKSICKKPDETVEPARGTAAYWIWKIDLQEVLGGNAMKAPLHHVEQLMKKSSTNDGDRRRLSAHLKLREVCMQFWPINLTRLNGKELNDAIDSVLKAGVAFPLTSRVNLLKNSFYKEWAEGAGVDIDDEGSKAMAQKVLKRFQPWRSSEVAAEFDPKNPTLMSVGLSDKSLCEMLIFELWVGKVANWISEGEGAAEAKVQTFCETLLAEWSLPEDAVVGLQAGEALLQSRKAAAVLLCLTNNTITKNTTVAQYIDAKLLEGAALQTAKELTVMAAVSQAVTESPSWSAKLTKTVKAVKYFQELVPIVVRSLNLLGSLASKGPSVEFCTHMIGMFSALPRYRATLVDGAVDEFELEVVKVALDMSKQVANSEGTDQFLCNNDLVVAHKKLLEEMVQAVPANDDARRLSKALAATVAKFAVKDRMHGLQEMMAKFMDGDQSINSSLLGDLRKMAKSDVGEDMVSSMASFFDFLCAQLGLANISNCDSSVQMSLLDALSPFMKSGGEVTRERMWSFLACAGQLAKRSARLQQLKGPLAKGPDREVAALDVYKALKDLKKAKGVLGLGFADCAVVDEIDQFTREAHTKFEVLAKDFVTGYQLAKVLEGSQSLKTKIDENNAIKAWLTDAEVDPEPDKLKALAKSTLKGLDEFSLDKSIDSLAADPYDTVYSYIQGGP